MRQTVEAIYKNGVIEPLEKLDLPESQRLRITIEPVEEEKEPQSQYDRAVAALKRAGARKLTPEEAERLWGPLHLIDRELAKRGFEKLGGKLSEEIIRDRGEY